MAAFWYLLGLIGGLVVLGAGGEFLVRGAARLARSLGVSALVVGLTIVAYGTSAPELAVSVQAVWKGESALAVGNVVGSNIANILLILGATAAFRAFRVSLNVLRTDGPIMVLAAAVFVLMALAPRDSGLISRVEGSLLVAGLFAYTVLTYRMARREPPEIEQEYHQAIGLAGSRLFNVGLMAAGLVGLVLGGRLIVDGAVGLATMLGVDQTFVGLTVVAVGTSLPELATSLAAVRQNQPDIALGNIVGSNICNILLVIGASACVGPVFVNEQVIFQDGPLMLVASLLFFQVVRTGLRVSRWEGLFLLACYVGYLAWTVARAAGG